MTMNITKGRIIFIRSSFLSECKNVQKSALKNVNVQTSAKSIFQFFACLHFLTQIFAHSCIRCEASAFVLQSLSLQIAFSSSFLFSSLQMLIL